MRWRLVIALLCAAVSFGFNSNMPGGSISGGNCTGGMFMTGITAGGAPVCGTPSGGAPYPPGSPPQVTGFSALNTGESETVGGDFTFARTGANAYTATVTKLNGVAVGALATLNVGTGLTSSAGSLSLTTPVAIANGGTGGTTAPSTNQILVASSATVFAPVTMSGDATINAGVVTVSKVGGVAFGPLATASTPLSIANGGRGSSTAPTAGQIDIAQSATAFGAVSMSGDCTIAATGAITCTKLNGVAPGTLYNATTPLAIANGGSGSSTAPTIGQLWIASSTTAFTPVSMSGDATITSAGVITVSKVNGVSGPFLTGAAGSITDTMLANAYSGVGACSAGTFVSTLNRNAAPTCGTPFTAGGDLSGTATSQSVIGIRSTAVPALASGYLHYNGTAFVWDTPATGSFAPLTNPAGGQNNYAPLAGPTFTGTTTVANLTAPSTATWTFPDGSTYTSAGHNSMLALGLGGSTAAPTTSGEIVANSNGNYNFNWSLTNTSTGTAAGTTLYVNNSTHYAAIQLNGTAGVANGFLADTVSFQTNAANGINISEAVTAPITFWTGGQNNVGSFQFLNSGGALVLPNSTSSSVYFGGTTTTPYASILAGAASNLNLAAGAHRTPANWVADATAASIITPGNGVVTFYEDTGLTAGSTYSPTSRANLTSSGFNLVSGENYLINGSQIAMANIADYSQGTWTPDLSFNSGNVGTVYSSRSGSYIKIGKLVHATFGFAMTSKGTSTGIAAVCCLPYNASSTSGWELSNCIYGNLQNVTTTWIPMFALSNGQTYGDFYAMQSNNPAGGVQYTDGNFTNTSSMNCSWDYTAQ